MERRKVVDVPSDSNASPGDDRATTEAGLSPVKGAMTHSTEEDQLSKFLWRDVDTYLD
jgi:hypothetical protein